MAKNHVFSITGELLDEYYDNGRAKIAVLSNNNYFTFDITELPTFKNDALYTPSGVHLYVGDYVNVYGNIISVSGNVVLVPEMVNKTL